MEENKERPIRNEPIRPVENNIPVKTHLDNVVKVISLIYIPRSSSINSSQNYVAKCKFCGIKTIRCLEPCINIKVFLVFLSLFVFLQSGCINGFVNVSIAPIEMRYGLSTFESGLIASMYDIGNLMIVYPVTYFGGASRKPTWLSLGALFLGIGSLIFCIPHFITGKYSYSKFDTLCSPNETTFNSPTVCLDNFTKLKRYKYIFYSAMMLMGMGGSSLYTLGYNYVDENSDKYESTLYIAILNIMSMIGPATGFLAGSKISEIYVDFEKGIWPNDITIKDTYQWVGAYWLPFVFAAVLLVLLSIPLMWFPSFISEKCYEKCRRNMSEIISHEGDDLLFSKFLELKIIKETKEVIFNKHFTLLALTASIEMFIMSSLSTLGSKLLINRFNVDQSKAGTYIGIGVIPSAVLALSISGTVIKRFKIKSVGLTRLAVVFSVIPLPAIFIFMLDCKSVKILGFQDNELGSCSTMCHCSKEAMSFSPICGSDSKTYFSPCIAGCAETKNSLKSVVYSNCSCIKSTSDSLSHGTGKPGACDSDCTLGKVMGFMASICVLVFCIYFTAIPIISLTLTCTRPNLRPIAFGIKMLYTRILGSLPGPPLTGLIFDNACSHRLLKCGTVGNCALYDQHLLSYPFLGLLIGLNLSAVLMLTVLWWIWDIKYEDFDDYGDDNDNKVTA